MGSVIAALIIVLRGFQAQKTRRNVASGVGVALCCACVFTSLQYLRSATRQSTPEESSFHGIGQRAPDFSYTSFDDHSVHHLSDFAGRLLVLTISSTPCPRCQAELMNLNALQQAYGDQIVVLAITAANPAMTDGAEWGPRLALRQGFVRSAADLGSYLPADMVQPETYLIDTHGLLRNNLIGQLSFDRLETEILRYLPPEVHPKSVSGSEVGQH